MTTLTELNELEQQVKAQREKLQELYSSIDYADDEVQDFVISMVDNVSQIECFKALVTLEIFTSRNGFQLKDLKVGTKVKDTESSKIEATYLCTNWIYENKERKDRLWIDIKEQKVVGIYYDYKYTD
ncbi:MAG: hypothetical protein D8H99_22485 [Streptococcus sp.]|nr:MAG: hypothetical protein D8H99_22485 [Streptococcus sp.]